MPKVYQPGMPDILACFVLLLKKHHNGQMTVPRSTIENINKQFSNKVDVTYFKAEDVVRITLTQTLESGIVLPRAGLSLN